MRTRFRSAALSATGALLVGCSADEPAPVAAPVGAPQPLVVAPNAQTTGLALTYITFYAAYDNDPPGSREIAYPNPRHEEAGGIGTYSDPLTLATSPDELPPGTLVYYPALKRYFVMEDDCEECIKTWASSRRPHLDLWVGASNDPGVLRCENRLTPAGMVPVEINPPPGRPVDPRPLYDNGRCRPTPQ